jgi:hypothetical protein
VLKSAFPISGAERNASNSLLLESVESSSASASALPHRLIYEIPLSYQFAEGGVRSVKTKHTLVDIVSSIDVTYMLRNQREMADVWVRIVEMSP